MRKTRAKMLKKLADEEAKKPEYKMFMETDQKVAFGRIHNGIKSLWYKGKI